MNVLLLVTDTNNGVFLNRIINPFRYIDNQDINYKFTNDVYEDELEWADCLILASIIYKPRVEVMKSLLVKYNVKLIVDVDDYAGLHKRHVDYDKQKLNNIHEYYIEYIEAADQVWVTNEVLCNYAKKYNDNVVVIPNAIPFGEGNYTDKKYLRNQRKTFIYSCNVRHKDDVIILQKPIKEINKQPLFKQSATMCMYGYLNGYYQNTWKVIENVFSAGKLEEKTYMRMPYATIDKYMDNLSIGDVGLVPLENNYFNQCKSNLKVLEYATKKIPAIISNVSSLTVNNPPCIIAKNDKDWVEAFMLYLKDENKRKEDGQKLHDWAVSNYSLKVINEIRVKQLTG